MSKNITIGMATCNDYEGVWATVQSALWHNKWESLDDVEIIIVDTSPVGSPHRPLVKDLVASHRDIAKYYDMPHVIGTTYPRDYIFTVATAPVVVVMDCHVMLPSDTLLQLSVWFDEHPECKDLVHGPMVYDNLTDLSTHFSDQFRGGMWGTWGSLWKSPEGKLYTIEGEEVTDEDRSRKSDGLCHFHDPMTLEELPSPQEDVPYAGHQVALRNLGWTEIGWEDSANEYEIPGTGMGLFACRKDAWLGFAKGCSGFGGEELNIHTKFRQAGHKAICLPFLKWNHRFGRSSGTPYPIPLTAKIRNYVLWANELSLPLDRIHTHFVKSGQFSEGEWQQLITDPINYPITFNRPQATGLQPLDALFLETANTARDLNEHAEFVQSIASSVNSITAFVKRTDWEPMLASGFPNLLNVYQSENTPLTQRTHDAVKIQDVKNHRKLATYNTIRGEVDPLTIDPIEPSELLVLDQIMRGDYVLEVLRKHTPTKFILLRGSQSFGAVAEFSQNDPGLWQAIKVWIKENPSWFIHTHRPNQYGMTLLSNDPTLTPPQEIRPWPRGFGPGTEMKTILASVGVNPSPTCDCNAYMLQMDEWGVEGCKERYNEIVARFVEKGAAWGYEATLTDKLNLAVKALYTGIAFKVNPMNPYPGLVSEAIHRAEIAGVPS